MSDATPGPLSDATPKPSAEPPVEPSVGSDGSGSSSGTSQSADQQARRKPRNHRGRPVTKADQADFEALKALCVQEGEDDPFSVWWTLRKEHNAAKPSLFMAKLVEYGEWQGFVGANGIGEYKSDGSAA